MRRRKRRFHPTNYGSLTGVRLHVPFAENDKAKQLGAKWSSIDRFWYVPEGKDLTHFKQWLLAEGGAVIPISQPPLKYTPPPIALATEPQQQNQTHTQNHTRVLWLILAIGFAIIWRIHVNRNQHLLDGLVAGSLQTPKQRAGIAESYSGKSYSSPPKPEKPTAMCMDETLSFSTGKGTCSHHGGVQYYLHESTGEPP